MKVPERRGPLLLLFCLIPICVIRGASPPKSKESHEICCSDSDEVVHITRTTTLATTLATTPATTPATTTEKIPTEDEYLQIGNCMEQKFTYQSCQKVFCPPWMRCIKGQCLCKLPYQCPKDTGSPSCGTDQRNYRSFCQVKSMGCNGRNVNFSHTGNNCTDQFQSWLNLTSDNVTSLVQMQWPGSSKNLLICGDTWKIPAANVICSQDGHERGAKEANTLKYSEVTTANKPLKCVNVLCTGLESTLAECTIYKEKNLTENMNVATVQCYTDTYRVCHLSREFPCVNGKCIALNRTCDGINDCGDQSDELCCKKCRDGFQCKSDVCIPWESVKDGVHDCLGGEDETEAAEDSKKRKEHPVSTHSGRTLFAGSHSSQAISNVTEGSHSSQAISNVTEEIVATRNAISSLTCGVRKATPVRAKRLLGGKVALKGEVPWQVGIDDQNEVYCGGIYIGGCWVLTAAHCVRPKPELYRVKLGMWNSIKSDVNTDSLPAEKVIIHEDFNPSTYENDIALIKFKNVYKNKECIRENKFIAPVCVPWSEYQFKPGHKCIISGWGRAEAYKRVYILNVATIEIIGNCSGIYKNRYFKGMECAGTFDGSVDTCQGDSGGPLVCTDDSGVAYVWGIVSWGEKCGVAYYPGCTPKSPTTTNGSVTTWAEVALAGITYEGKKTRSCSPVGLTNNRAMATGNFTEEEKPVMKRHQSIKMSSEITILCEVSLFEFPSL
ncbi:LOW QUALITY PROTEIN: complement factor I [Erpetoichthys calabaricus]|uniref:LOW QUALITY PROTEIN: complement factor I n=1 Tax=Erpetoichthys calabaricus TaxID=27687 RepID=UPI002234AE44|nr:LOW QUALITY PROTEIN: complement factor I [Erpetoichthys calabaricus]